MRHLQACSPGADPGAGNAGPGLDPPSGATMVVRASNPDAQSPPAGVQPPAPAPKPPPSSPEYGIHAFLWWRPEDAERDMLLVKEMGFRWIKQGVGWRDVEAAKGEYDWSRVDFIVDTMARYGGLELLARIDHQPTWSRADGCTSSGPPDDPQDLADFAGAMAGRYAGRIRAYEIWNEPNLAREWCGATPDPAAYAQLLGAAYGAIKAADPSALVISAGLAPTGTGPPAAVPDEEYLRRMYQAMGGTGAGYFDMLGLHAPGYAAPPETSPAEAVANTAYGGQRFFAFRHVEDMRAIQESFGDGDRRVAILEMGWSSDPVHPEYAWHRVTEAQKADYLVRAYQYAAANWRPWIGPMITIFMCNADWTQADEQYWWCIDEPNGAPRPAFEALRAMPKVTD
ncbi:MAG: hypothetical protein ACE5EL_04050 [Anaerolineae bacterium]